MAYKDEYEVARLHAVHTLAQVESQVAGENLRLEFHLAPPLFARRDPVTGLPAQDVVRAVDAHACSACWRSSSSCAARRSIRSATTAERRTERQLIADYEALLAEILAKLNPDNHHLAVGLAAIPEKIRGFGHVKARHLKAAKADEAALLDQFRSGGAPLLKAAE